MEGRIIITLPNLVAKISLFVALGPHNCIGNYSESIHLLNRKTPGREYLQRLWVDIDQSSFDGARAVV